MNRFTGAITNGYTKANKQEIQAALTRNLSIGTCLALCNEYYGELIIVPTGVAGNLVLQHGFYPIAYIRPETLTAALNVEVTDSGQFARVQNLIKEICAKVIECHGADKLIEFVDANQDFS